MDTNFSDRLVNKYNQDETNIRVHDVWRVPNSERNLLGLVTLEINQLFFIKRIQVYRNGMVVFPKETNRGDQTHRIFVFRNSNMRRHIENIVIAGMDDYIRREEPIVPRPVQSLREMAAQLDGMLAEATDDDGGL